jgi:Fe-S cluster assembly protein SufD
MNTIDHIKERIEVIKLNDGGTALDSVQKNALRAFGEMGIPSVKHEEWKYTRIGGLFNKEYTLAANRAASSVTESDLHSVRLPGYEHANELVFVNGVFSFPLSVIRSTQLVVLPLEDAASNGFSEIVSKNFGHSARYLRDGINALNTALVSGGVFIHVKKGQITEHPVYIYNIADSRSEAIFAQPRSLVHIAENAQLQITETYITLGSGESLTNQVMEIVVEKAAVLEYYKIQNDSSHANQVSSTHIRQVGKSNVHSVVISLKGGIVRNNLNVVMEAEFCEAHLYGLYFEQGQSHIDNHTVVDNVLPNCFSNQLYKGIMNDDATGVFNGKIFVRPQAQKTNAYQSNKNILLSDSASVNTKPQLEIFADDVKCSHGCTVGRLNEEGMFYLQSRGLREEIARALLLQAYAIDVLDHIKPAPVRLYINQLISERLALDII